MSISDARVTDDVEQRLVGLELLDLSTHAVGDVARRRLVGERLAELVQRPAHLSQLLLDRLGVQPLERTCNSFTSLYIECGKVSVRSYVRNGGRGQLSSE